jgi:hypothetical protein
VKKLFALVAFCAIPACAQSLFSIGVVGGAPFTDVVNTTSSNFLNVTPKSTNFTIGPSLQVNLPLSLRLEVDALYRPYSFTGTSGPPQFPVNSAPTTVSASEWGVVLGGGADVKIPFIRLSGELRYTHLGSSYFQAISNLNQAEVLLGVHF